MEWDDTRAEAAAESWPASTPAAGRPREVEVSHGDLGGEAALAKFKVPA